MLGWIDAAAARFEGMDRVCFYARIAAMLREGEVGRDAAEWRSMLKRASNYTDRESIRANERFGLKRAS